MRFDPGDPAAANSGGMLPVDKPVGPTSHDVVARVRRALGERRIGHTGTLDPFASGLLLLLLGPATRLSEYLTGLDKTYEATAVLGVETETLDPEGAVVGEDDAWRDLDAEEVRSGLESFRGRSLQIPPRYSAKKIGGEAAHRRVRRGEEVELEPVPVEIGEIELLEASLPEVRFRLRCSSGTYVRAVARDLGRRLGTGAHLTALRRTAVGPFDVADALPLSAVEVGVGGAPGEGSEEGEEGGEEDAREDGEENAGEDAGVDALDPVMEAVAGAWVPAARALPQLPALQVGADEEERIRHGRAVEIRPLEGRRPDEAAAPDVDEAPAVPGAPSEVEGAEEGSPVVLVREGRLLAVGERRGTAIHPRKVFVGG